MSDVSQGVYNPLTLPRVALDHTIGREHALLRPPALLPNLRCVRRDVHPPRRAEHAPGGVERSVPVIPGKRQSARAEGLPARPVL